MAEWCTKSDLHKYAFVPRLKYTRNAKTSAYMRKRAITKLARAILYIEPRVSEARQSSEHFARLILWDMQRRVMEDR